MCPLLASLDGTARFVNVRAVVTLPTFPSRDAMAAYQAAREFLGIVATMVGLRVFEAEAKALTAHPWQPDDAEWFGVPPPYDEAAVGNACVRTLEGVLVAVAGDAALAALRGPPAAAGLTGDVFGQGPGIVRRASYCMRVWDAVCTASPRVGVPPPAPCLGAFSPSDSMSDIVWYVLKPLETMCLYGATTRMLSQLLDSPYNPYRRGKVYTRLAVDLEHLRKKSGLDVAASRERVRAVIARGLADPCVRGGDRMDLIHRAGSRALRVAGGLPRVAAVGPAAHAAAGAPPPAASSASDSDGSANGTARADAATGAAVASAAVVPSRRRGTSVVVPRAAAVVTPYHAVLHARAVAARGGAPTPFDVTKVTLVVRPFGAAKTGRKRRYAEGSHRAGLPREVADGGSGGGGGGGCAPGSMRPCACQRGWDADEYGTDFGVVFQTRVDDIPGAVTVEKLALDYYRCGAPVLRAWC